MFSLSVVWFAYDLIVSGCRIVVKLLVRELTHIDKLFPIIVNSFIIASFVARLVKRVPVNTADTKHLTCRLVVVE